MDEVAAFLVDLRQMVPLNAQRFVDWEQTRTEQGSWPIKTMVRLRFKNDTNLATMIELRRVAKDELKKKLCKLHGQLAKARFETSPQKKP